MFNLLRALLEKVVIHVFEELEFRGVDLEDFGGQTVNEIVDRIILGEPIE